MADEDRSRWNARYADPSGPVGSVSPALLELSRFVPTEGAALDVAGGSGRNALWLAARGLDTTIVDIADEGLARAGEAAQAASLPLHTVRLDLEQQPLPAGPWALVLCSHYLQRDLVAVIAPTLAVGGRFVWIHPTVDNLQRHDKPGARFLLAAGEAQALVEAAGLAVEWSQEAWVGEANNARHLARVVARRGAG